MTVGILLFIFLIGMIAGGRSYMLDTGEKYDNKATDHQPAVVTCHRPEITAERDWQQNPGRYRKRN